MPKKTKKPPKQLQRHFEAYEYYYQLGDNRTLELVAKKFRISTVTAQEWRTKFHWVKRIEERDANIAKKISRKADQEIVDVKLSYRKEIRSYVSIVKQIIEGVIDPITHLPLVQAGDVADLVKIVNTYEKLVRLDLDILGDAPLQNNAPLFKLVDALSTIVTDGKYKADANLRGENKTENEIVGREIVNVSMKHYVNSDGRRNNGRKKR